MPVQQTLDAAAKTNTQVYTALTNPNMPYPILCQVGALHARASGTAVTPQRCKALRYALTRVCAPHMGITPPHTHTHKPCTS